MSKPHILIVGAGAWGASTAVALLQSGKYTVTLLDRAAVLPAEDAASTDINKIVRFDYQEEVYAELAFQALGEWRKKEWEGMYFESGTVVVAPIVGKGLDLNKTIANVSRRGPVVTHSTPEEVQRALDPKDKGVTGDMTGHWYLIRLAAELGGEVVPAAEAVELIIGDGDVKGVRCKNGRQFKGDKVIVSAGAWTAGLLKGLLPEGLITSTGIMVAAFKLSEEEYERYKDIPVIMGFDETGFYSMPPTHDRMLKFGLDEAGYTSQTGTPRTTLTPGASEEHQKNNTSWLPRRSHDDMRVVVNMYFPEFKDRPFDFTRMCPIPASFDDHFVLDYTKQYPSLLVASAGSHHSYKMMPIIGTLVQQRLENTLDPALTALWAIRQPTAAADEFTHSKATGKVDIEDVVFAGEGEVPQVKGSAILGKIEGAVEVVAVTA